MYDRLLLVKPPEQSRFNFGCFSLGVLAAAVRDIAKVSILDATDLSTGDTVRRIRAANPDLIGITAMGLRSVPPVAALISRLCATPARSGRVPVVVGGHGATMLPETLLDAGAGVVVLGEGEVTFRELVESGIEATVPGTITGAAGNTRRGPARPLVSPLDQLTSPARDLMPPPRDGIHLMETSRGCPHACAFCETTRFNGRRWRPFSPERVTLEVRRLVDDYDAWIIQISDDSFAASPARVREICRQLRRQTRPAFFLASARADDLTADPRLLEDMAAASILRITVGVETLDPASARSIGKPIDVTVYQQAFARMRSLGIFSCASLIVGLPGEDPEQRRMMVEMAVRAGPDAAQFLPFLPLPGVPLAADAKSSEPPRRDCADADRFTLEFFRSPEVQARLEAAAGQPGIRGRLAKATIHRWSKTIKQKTTNSRSKQARPGQTAVTLMDPSQAQRSRRPAGAVP